MKHVSNHESAECTPEVLPVIPTMGVVVFPHMIVPLLVLDKKIINGINKALEGSKNALLLAAKSYSEDQETIGINDLYQIGTIANIIRVIRVPEGGLKLLVQGVCKGRAKRIITQDDTMFADIERIHEEEDSPETLMPHLRNIKAAAEKMANTNSSFSPDFHIILSRMANPDKIVDFILSHLPITVQQGQELLETESKSALLEKLYHYLEKEVEVSEIQERIKRDARESMNQSQREYYLREQLKVIKRELGEDDAEDVDLMYERLSQLNMPEETKQEVHRQISRLERASPDSLEAAVTRNYLEWILEMPWGIETEDNLDIKHAKEILDADHYGVPDVKDRILDLISIRKLNKDGNAPILCFVGPPGTGKTSLGKSIARSLGRKYARISLGGVRDEAEIRGHRRTYVGAIPGRIIQAIRKAESCNPVIVIDEMDKVGADFRGDPSAAMLEVLDPQQNKQFHDNYLGIPFDLSKVMFIATANSLDTISAPLRDRMEIIELSGYTLDEKINISKQHLVQRGIEGAGLKDHKIDLNDDVLRDLVMNYTRESGVRQLERIIAKLCTKAARSFVETDKIPKFTPKNIDTYLGPRRFLDDETSRKDQIGISNGLAKTPYGGEIIQIESVLLPGSGKLILTGQLGSVMRESAQAALSYARAHAKEFGLLNKIFTTHDLHIHVPAGAIPKDGPSAGITMLTAILSSLTQRPVSAEYAMTGELNLQGDVMPIGGVKEKILAAKQNNMRYIILPAKNKNDLTGLDDIIKGIDVILVSHVDEVINRVLQPKVRKTGKA